jgi:hypothetical protein
MQPSPCLSGDDRGRESFGGFNSRRLHHLNQGVADAFGLFPAAEGVSGAAGLQLKKFGNPLPGSRTLARWV